MKLDAIPTAMPRIPPSIRVRSTASANAAANKVTDVAAQPTRATKVRHGQGHEPTRKASGSLRSSASTQSLGNKANRAQQLGQVEKLLDSAPVRKAARNQGVELAGVTAELKEALGADQPLDTNRAERNLDAELVGNIKQANLGFSLSFVEVTDEPDKAQATEVADFRKPAISTSATTISQSSAAASRLTADDFGPVIRSSDLYQGDIDLGDFTSNTGSVRPSAGPFVPTGYDLNPAGGNTAVVDRSSGAAAVLEPLIAGHESVRATANVADDAVGPSGSGNGVGASTPGGIEPIAASNGTASGDSNGNPNNREAGSSGPFNRVAPGQADPGKTALSSAAAEPVPTAAPDKEMAKALNAYEKALGLNGPDRGPLPATDEPETIGTIAFEGRRAAPIEDSLMAYRVEFTGDFHEPLEKSVDLVI